MAKSSSIEWCDATINPCCGCTPVSPACDHCYAARMAHRLALNIKIPPYFAGLTDNAGKWTGQVNLHPQLMKQVLRWQKPRKIFVGSMTDLFHEAVPDGFLDQIFAVMALAPQHTFMVLSKRPERMREYMEHFVDDACRPTGCPIGGPLPNVWLGVTAENQAMADERIPTLLDTPAAKRFVSIEPTLGPLDLRSYLQDVIHQDEIGLAGRNGPLITANDITDHDPWMRGLSWVICGGENGHGARPMHPDWARALRDQCSTADVPFFFKGWGEWTPYDPDAGVVPNRSNGYSWGTIRMDGMFFPETTPWTGERGEEEAAMVRVGKHAAGRLLDGIQHDEFPKEAE